jgi:ABC-2 type transport system permease protein
MNKYFALFKIHWQNFFVYNVSFILWRLRQFLLTFTSITVWITIFHNSAHVFNYDVNSMISYIFLAGFLQSLILATQTGGLGNQIYSGEISNRLVQPINIFGALISQELADKTLNFSFVALETIILYFLFKPQILFPSLPIFLLFTGATLLGAVLIFFVMMLMSTMGFWSPDTWGPRFLFYIFMDFTAGKLYPLNILPILLQKVLFFTPFPYLSYVQTQIFLNKFSSEQILHSYIALFIWIAITGISFRFFWQKGIKEYGAAGR